MLGAFESQVNKKVTKDQHVSANPKFTFESKELYGQAQELCQMIPHWEGEAGNPIH